MATAELTIESDVLDVLSRAVWNDRGLILPEQLERSLYQRTAKVLAALGGKWNRKEQATLFEDADAEAALRETVRTGVYVDAKKLYQFFETPDMLARDMAQMLCEQLGVEDLTGKSVLEPSAGKGAIAHHLRVRGAAVTAVELNPKHIAVLQHMQFSAVVSRDFLTCPSDDFCAFDGVVMNPPFSSGQYIEHIRHAWTFLRAGGVLLSVAPPSFQYRSDKKYCDFREWLEAQDSSVLPLPDKTFRESGTDIATVLIRLTK